MTRESLAASTILKGAKNPAPAALLCAAAALPHLLSRGCADAPSRIQTRRPRRLWGREDGFTMAAPR
ncbi:hypothetical protein KP004_02450 [Geomonas oryzisoli]|uniref:Uncharacterized protein n=1 Tax=Geomonas oryzisoli TaxID=2847992 RepID=A0ABX8J6K3_9BACT|nr:hypothetical protein [Geomonas oryzisoli]QWV94069.1 hypothetical protein KP004_02450 [Geomonas oryzisoli]